MWSSAIQILRTRGALSLASAVFQLFRAKVGQHVLGRRFIQRAVFDYRMFLDMEDSGISRSLLLFGSRELDHRIMLTRILEPGMRIFDIGANIGYYAIMERRAIGETGKLIAIEPSPSNVELLKRNLALNGLDDVPIVAGAVSNQSGERAFSLSHMSNLNTFHPTDDVRTAMSGETIQVRTTTVPELAAEYGSPDLIRMDVEGHEVEVIDGFLEAVEAGEMSPMVIFETHLTRYGSDHDMAAVLERLFACGYHVPLAASSWEAGTETVSARGYQPVTTVKTDDVVRAIFENIAPADAIEFICRIGGLRTVLLAPKARH